jgi:hypothetical protein
MVATASPRRPGACSPPPATARPAWVEHPERVRAAVDRQLARPILARLHERYQGQLAFLARRLRPEGAFGLSLTLGLVGVALAGWSFGLVLQDVPPTSS